MVKQLAYLLILLSAFTPLGKTVITRWVITNGCSLKVDGSTNVNNFSCAISNYSKPDTILVNRNVNPVLLSGNIQLDVQNFDCHNGIMTADLRKTLKAKEFPKLVIRFLNISRYPQPDVHQSITRGSVFIELAGVSKRFDVDYKVVSADNNYINLVGSRVVNFSDFNLTPPRKLGGMIRTKNELSVEFNLRIKVLN
ncbi:MAG TPA: YceI family protein [Flavisolibacter sp.]|nr:YceI family protein [Flavisolibacter sp.]